MNDWNLRRSLLLPLASFGLLVACGGRLESGSHFDPGAGTGDPASEREGGPNGTEESDAADPVLDAASGGEKNFPSGDASCSPTARTAEEIVDAAACGAKGFSKKIANFTSSIPCEVLASYSFCLPNDEAALCQIREVAPEAVCAASAGECPSGKLACSVRLPTSSCGGAIPAARWSEACAVASLAVVDVIWGQIFVE